jgi:hypothetical protein
MLALLEVQTNVLLGLYNFMPSLEVVFSKQTIVRSQIFGREPLQYSE